MGKPLDDFRSSKACMSKIIPGNNFVTKVGRLSQPTTHPRALNDSGWMLKFWLAAAPSTEDPHYPCTDVPSRGFSEL